MLAKQLARGAYDCWLALLSYPQCAQVVHLPQRHAVQAQDAVGGGGVEIEIRKRERQQKAVSGKGDFGTAHPEGQWLARQRINVLPGFLLQAVNGLRIR